MIKRSFGGIKTYYLISLFLVIFIFIFLGSFIDLSLDRLIYSPGNIYADFFEYTGTLPASIVIATSGVFLYYYLDNKNNQKLHSLKVILLLLLTLGVGLLWGYDAFHSHLDSLVVSLVIGIIVISCTNGFFFYYLKNGENKDEYLKKALLLIICGAISFGLTFLIKGIIVRPRYMAIRMFLNNDESFFRPWYLFSTFKSK